jgi:hypothetical protein
MNDMDAVYIVILCMLTVAVTVMAISVPVQMYLDWKDEHPKLDREEWKP